MLGEIPGGIVGASEYQRDFVELAAPARIEPMPRSKEPHRLVKQRLDREMRTHFGHRRADQRHVQLVEQHGSRQLIADAFPAPPRSP